MGHNRIKMELINKESTRMQTYQKRKKSLKKKVSEFSVLCDVEALLIIFGPKLEDQTVSKLDTIWPSNPDEAERIINKYRKTDKAKRCYHVSDYFSDKKKQIDVEISKLHKKVCEARFPSWDVSLNNFNEDQLRALLSQLEVKLQAADQKLYLFQENHKSQMSKFMSRMVHNPCNMENYMSGGNNSHVFPNPMKPLDVQVPMRFVSEQNLYTFPSNSSSSFMASSSNNVCSTNLPLYSDFRSALTGRNLMEVNNSSSSSSNNMQLQLFSPKPLDVQLPMYFQPQHPFNQNQMEDVTLTTQMSNNQNFSNQFGGRDTSNIPFLSGLSYVNPPFQMMDDAMLNNVDASMPFQTMMPRPRMQLPLFSLPNQVCPQADRFGHDIGSQM